MKKQICPHCQEEIRFTFLERLYKNNFKIICKHCGTRLIVDTKTQFLFLMCLVGPAILVSLFRISIPLMPFFIGVVIYALLLQFILSPYIIRYREPSKNEII